MVRGSEKNHVITSSSRKVNMDHPDFAKIMDEIDPLKHLRDEFYYPKMKDLPYVDLNLVNPEDDSIYLCGNSLGLQPKKTSYYLQREMEKWAKMGVYGHFLGATPWSRCDEHTIEANARIVGAKPSEIAVMNGLSVNLHLLMASFYRPTKERNKILIEAKAFPSDHFIAESQIRFHKFDPKECLIVLQPRQGEDCLRHEDIFECIKTHGPNIALILFSGIQYYTGQLFDIRSITKAGHDQGCLVGWDMAHAAGNVPLHLHDWDVDFAAWCSYKYLNASCGGLGVVFLHEKHAFNDYPRFCGWWSDDKEHRMNMTNNLHLTPGAAGYRISNPPIFLVCPMLASMDIFNKTSMEDLRERSINLTGYLHHLLVYHLGEKSPHRTTDAFCHIVTPANADERGCQLSLKFSISLHDVFRQLQKRGVVVDERLPYVLRVSPVHLYNSFTDVKRFVEALICCLKECGRSDKLVK